MSALAEVREYAGVADFGLPRFRVGQVLEINGQRVVVTKVVSQSLCPARAKLEVAAVVEQKFPPAG